MNKICIAGAGPGDPDLITVKLMHALAEADVVVMDRLVNFAIVEKYAAPDVEVISVGKEGYNNTSFSQQDINQLLVELYHQGKKVLRLKGGDVAFFSNVYDELLTLHYHAIPFEIIPGITAASGASAYTGIPLTARGYANNVQFLTFSEKHPFSVLHWKSLAFSKDTLVFYMATKKLHYLVSQLQAHSDEPKLLAVIEQATTPFQRVITFSLPRDNDKLFSSTFHTPALVIIGDVVSLHDDFGWYQTSYEEGTVFKTLATI